MNPWTSGAWVLVGAWAGIILASYDTASDASKETLYSLNGFLIFVSAIFIGAWLFTQVEK